MPQPNYSCAPVVDEHITRALLNMYPRHFLVWNPTFKLAHDGKEWEPRWEIWIELKANTHPKFRERLSKGDRWNTDAQCFMRRLQAYQTEDYQFAPIDERLLIGLELADTWEDKFFADEHLDNAAEREEIKKELKRREIHAGSASYFRKHDVTSVGAYVNSGWRWRTR